MKTIKKEGTKHRKFSVSGGKIPRERIMENEAGISNA